MGHFHVERKSKTAGNKKAVCATMLDSLDAKDEMVRELIEKFDAKIHTMGIGIITFTNGDTVTSYPCNGECLDNVKTQDVVAYLD